MTNTIKLLLALALVLCGATSCLDKQPADAIPADKALQTVEDANQAVLGIYAGFKSPSLYSGAMTLCPDIQADLTYAVEGYTNKYGEFWRWEILANNKEIETVYADLYTVIGRCNFLLAYADRIRQNTTDDAALDAFDDILGETYFARALAYSELIKLYCKDYEPDTAATTPGVVLVTNYHNPEPARRATLEASYRFVLEDLKRATDFLTQECQPNGAASNLFTISTINALYARVYLYMHDWKNAIAYSTKTIEDPALGLASILVGATSKQSMYDYMWTNDISNEVIWRVNFSPSSYGGALGRVFLDYNYRDFKPDYVPANWALKLYDKNDQRYTSFFKTVTTGYPHQLTCPVLIKYYGNPAFLAQRILHVNMPKVFRLSEQYLIRAEAYCQLKNFGKAGQDITALRTKRIVNYGSANLSESTWLKTISEERVRELFMEGFRLNDLKRWKMGFERTPQLSTIATGSSLKISADNPLYVWPIPQHELDVPGAEIEPNESNN